MEANLVPRAASVEGASSSRKQLKVGILAEECPAVAGEISLGESGTSSFRISSFMFPLCLCPVFESYVGVADAFEEYRTDQELRLTIATSP